MTAPLAFLFDMDGVLIDSNPLHVAAWEQYLARFGVVVPDLERRMVGKRNDQIVRDFLGSELSEDEVFQHGARKEALYRELMAPRLVASLMPGIREFLTAQARVPAGVGTNAEPANVEFVLNGGGLDQYFQAVVHGHEVEQPKPDPAVYRLLAAKLGVPAERCVVFEDSPSGAGAGVAAGAKVVGVGPHAASLPGVALAIPDFRSPDLRLWLSSTVSAV